MPDEIKNSQLPTPNSRLILIVEDSATQAEMLRRILVHEGYEVIVAKDGAEGLEAARKSTPALILSDINMPVMDGYEMCSKIKQDAEIRDIPLILLTQLYEPEEVLTGLESGADAYITKPYNEDYILSMVKVTLENPQGFRNNPDKKFVEFDYQGKHYTVHSGRAQTMSFLISSYESALMKNMDLLMTQEQLKMLNETLDEKVKERTAELELEISERRHAEASMRDSEERYRTLFEQSPYGVLLIDPETQTAIEFNEKAHRQLGYSREEFSHLKIQDYTTETPEQIKARIGKLMLTLSDDFEVGAMTKQGVIRNVLVTTQVIEIRGKPFISVIFHDITERKKAEDALKESEKKYRDLVNNAVVGVYRSNLKGDIIFMNQAMANMYEFETPEEVISAGALARWKNLEDRKHFIDMLLKNSRVDDFEADMLTKTGKVKHVLFNATIEGDVFSGMLVDITERKKLSEVLRNYTETLEAEVKNRTSQLEVANKSLESFSYSVSHDLRAPLRAITGFSGILLEDYADKIDDEGKRLLNVVKNNVQKMGQLIDDILAFSRAGRKELELTEIDMDKLAGEVIEELRPTFAERKVQFEIKTLPPAKGDRAALRQVFTNLISNAIKFTRSRETAIIEVGAITGGESQELGVGSSELNEIRDTRNELIYYIKDNGAGFNMENAGKLFGVFQRLHSAEEFEGTGIGLSIVKTFIVKHGGRVWAEGKVGEGAYFYFSLPKTEDGI